MYESDLTPKIVKLNLESKLPAADTLTDEQRAELTGLAQYMASKYKDFIAYYRREMVSLPKEDKIPDERLDEMATYPASDHSVQDALTRPASELTWANLHGVMDHNPGYALQMLRALTDVAFGIVESGMYVAEAVGADTSPLERGKFKVIRGAFYEAWKPRDAIEGAMVDSLAQSFYSYNKWMRLCSQVSGHEGDIKTQVEKKGEWVTPRLDFTQYQDRAFNMADRFNRMFLRTLRQMRDLRRYQMPVTINNPQQVNIAAEGGQQVNVQANNDRKKKPRRARHKPKHIIEG